MAASADGNIVTDAIATYAALPVLGTKTDDTVRTDAENATYCGAEWATEVDAALKDINAWFNAQTSASDGGWQYDTLWGSCYSTSTALYYLPFGSQTENTSIVAAGVVTVAPCDGQVIELQVNAFAAAGSTTVGFHKNANTTAVEQDTVVLAAGTTGLFTFTPATCAFSKGDQLHFSITCAASQSHLSWRATIKLDWSTL